MQVLDFLQERGGITQLRIEIVIIVGPCIGPVTKILKAAVSLVGRSGAALNQVQGCAPISEDMTDPAIEDEYGVSGISGGNAIDRAPEGYASCLLTISRKHRNLKASGWREDGGIEMVIKEEPWRSVV